MPPIAVHHTAVSDTGGWDGPKNKANLNMHDTEAYYRQAFAWMDSEGDPENKGTYKFIHHLVSESGEVGAASLSGCIMGIGILNGARTGTTIPDADYKGVWSHLAAHIRDDDREPPELKAYQPGIMRAGSSAPNREERVLSMPQLEIRSGVGSNAPMIVGYAAVFNQPSEILNDWMFGGFR